MTKKPDKKNAKAPRKKKGAAPKRRSALRWLFKWGFVAAIWGAVAALAMIAWYGYDLPDISDLGERQRNPSITLVAADGEECRHCGDQDAFRDHRSGPRLPDSDSYNPRLRR